MNALILNSSAQSDLTLCVVPQESGREPQNFVADHLSPTMCPETSAAEQLQYWLSQIDSDTDSESAEINIASYLRDSMAPIQPLEQPNICSNEILKLMLATEGCSSNAALCRTR